ncbi:MAG TPA: hypothetical protein VFP65_05210 [Anaeromyxobacteraceae bacterium]|nr:hypothetical protein [Anaeromyxobacteraceae bacterium]
MTWLLLGAVVATSLLVLPGLRRRRVFKTGEGPVSTLSISKKHEKKKQAALDAASSALR